jgi:glyoxylase-like metal-dependent hydrolase (beta-lactamase superfamily II)
VKTWYTKSGYKIYRILAGRSNVFLLTGNGKNILIDTSPGYRWNRLRKRLTSLNINKIDYLILTHTHFDHAANAAKIKNEYGAKIIVSRFEAGNFERGENTMISGTVLILRSLVKHIGPLILAKFNYDPCKPDILSDDHFDLRQFGFNGYILHTPGHSPGSQSIIVENEIALAGDSMFGIFPGSVFPPFAQNERELIISWGKLINTGCLMFLPSHGTPNRRGLLIREYQKRNHRGQ